MKRTLIQHATIVNEGQQVQGSVVIEGEKIVEVLAGGQQPGAPCETVIDATGCYLLPGVIDDHIHFRDPGLTHKADIYTESQAAAAGGVTSIMDMPNTNPPTTTLEAWESKMELMAEKSLVNYSCYFGATNTNYIKFGELDPHRVCGIKLFMGSSTGNMLVERMSSLQSIFSSTDLLIATHCEDQDIITKNTAIYKTSRWMKDGDLDIRLHPQIRSEEACYKSSALAIQLAKEAGARLHVLHITTAKELELFDGDKPLAEKKITAEVCVPHLLYSSADYGRLGGKIKCNPAIKDEPNRTILRGAINTNKIDVIATDHAPHLLSEKEGGALKAMSGMPMIQFSLVSMLELATEGVLSIEKVVEKMCHAPAEIYQINNRGYIRPGYQADLVLVKPDSPWTVTTDIIRSKCEWSPREGDSFQWKVDKTFVNGNLVFNNNEVDDTYRGQALRFR
ncbi:dihydroorotase [Bacteroides sp. 51]|uniref:dihydroorotase n=1 Tax=Bacteroides sp. 51 TaxID=2302938 RepID=UPI0013D440C5|nr:dihydroorotase [Bacteroides sp. 51]NDV81395.1 dihydroorotase [Bacteroides sp. 51]